MNNCLGHKLCLHLPSFLLFLPASLPEAPPTVAISSLHDEMASLNYKQINPTSLKLLLGRNLVIAMRINTDRAYSCPAWGGVVVVTGS